MTQTPPAATAAGEQVSPQPASATEALYRAALSGAQLAHYLPAFARFDELGMARTQWNHAAAWLGWHWLLYHRLWRHALLHALGVALAVAAWWWLQRVAGPWPEGVRWGLLVAIAAVAVAVPGLWGDAWLHADVRRRMTAAVRRARTVQEACTLLARPSAAQRMWVAVMALEAVALVLVGWRLGDHDEGVASTPPAPEPVLSERVPEVREAVATTPATTPTTTPAPAIAASPEPTPAPAPAIATATSSTSASTEPLPSPLPTPEPPASAAGADAPRARLGGHGVAVGIFADPANAERAAQRLRGAGLPVVVDPLESARGPLTRVRVGPLGTHDEALGAAETVRNLGLEAKVYGPR